MNDWSVQILEELLFVKEERAFLNKFRSGDFGEVDLQVYADWLEDRSRLVAAAHAREGRVFGLDASPKPVDQYQRGGFRPLVPGGIGASGFITAPFIRSGSVNSGMISSLTGDYPGRVLHQVPDYRSLGMTNSCMTNSEDDEDNDDDN